MGLVELGQHTGLSPALLSKIERGRLFPTLPTLLRIALVFSVGLDFFFAGAREKPLVAVVRKAQRVRLPERPGGRQLPIASNRSTTRRPSAGSIPTTRSFFPRRRASCGRTHHPGVEFIYALAGTLERAHRGRRACARGWRLDVFRFEHSARLQAQRRPDVQRHRRHHGLISRHAECPLATGPERPVRPPRPAVSRCNGRAAWAL